MTTEVNGSAIYCSEDGNENGAPMIAINIIIIQRYDYKIKHGLKFNNEYGYFILNPQMMPCEVPVMLSMFP